MHTSKLVAPRTFEIHQTDTPSPQHGEVLVRSDAVGICRSDIHYFEAGRIGDSVVEFPFTLGHETAGTVVECGPGVETLSEGTRVAIEPAIHCGVCEWCERGDPNLCVNIRFHGSPPVEGTMRQYFAHPAHLCVPLPESMTMDDGVMLEPLAIGVHVNRLTKTSPGKTVVVLGCGPVGLMTLAVARQSGAGCIIAVDPIDHRLALAKRYGADHTISGESHLVERVVALTSGYGADVVIEATSDPDAPGLAIDIASPGGVVAPIGITDETSIPLPSHTARRKGLTIRWIRRSKLALHAAMDLAVSGRIPLDGLVTHHFPLMDVQNGFECAEAYEDRVFKAVIQPNE
jgi:L-iditol 2-dehydrogenase